MSGAAPLAAAVAPDAAELATSLGVRVIVAQGTLLDASSRRAAARAERALAETLAERERAAAEERAFLENLLAGMSKRSLARSADQAQVAEQAQRAGAALRAEMRERTAAVALQRVARGFLSRRVGRQRRSALTRIQLAMRAVVSRARALRERLQRRQARERQEHKQRELEQRQRELEQRQREHEQRQRERALMDAEAGAAQALRLIYLRERRALQLEDELARALRLAEREREERERRQLAREDALAAGVRELLARQAAVAAAQAAEQERACAAAARAEAERAARLRDEAERDLARRRACARALVRGVSELPGGGFAVDVSGGQHALLADAAPEPSQAIVLEGVGRDLRVLAAEGNAFERFADLAPRAWFGPSLRELRLGHNVLSSLTGLPLCAGLTALDLSHNRLTAGALESALPGGLVALPALERLDLSHNPLGVLQPAWWCSGSGSGSGSALRVLALAGCQLRALPERLSLPRLQVLRLDGNEIAGGCLVHQSCALPALVELSLARNRISRLEEHCAHVVPSLQVLDLSGNAPGLLAPGVEPLVAEHIHLRRLDCAPARLGREQVRDLSRFLRQLEQLDGDLYFRQRAFLPEIVTLQAAWRGAAVRERVRLALQGARLSDPDAGDYAHEVDLREFDHNLSDDDDLEQHLHQRMQPRSTRPRSTNTEHPPPPQQQQQQQQQQLLLLQQQQQRALEVARLQQIAQAAYRASGDVAESAETRSVPSQLSKQQLSERDERMSETASQGRRNSGHGDDADPVSKYHHLMRKMRRVGESHAPSPSPRKKAVLAPPSPVKAAKLHASAGPARSDRIKHVIKRSREPQRVPAWARRHEDGDEREHEQ